MICGIAVQIEEEEPSIVAHILCAHVLKQRRLPCSGLAENYQMLGSFLFGDPNGKSTHPVVDDLVAESEVSGGYTPIVPVEEAVPEPNNEAVKSSRHIVRS